MTIKAKETHRLGDRVLVGFFDIAGNDIYEGGRYVDAALWDSDPEAVIADVAAYLSNVPEAPESAPAKRETVVTMTDQEIAAKRLEMRK